MTGFSLISVQTACVFPIFFGNSYLGLLFENVGIFGIPCPLLRIQPRSLLFTLYISLPEINPTIRSRSTCTMSWVPLDRGEVKLNIDASVHIQSRNSAVGNLLQDHYGFCIGAFNAKIKFMSPLHAEITTIKLGDSVP